MSLDSDSSLEVWGLMQKLLHHGPSVTESMLALIAHFERAIPHPDWRKLRALDYDCEITNLRDTWLARVLREEPPIDKGVTGFWFGLFHPVKGLYEEEWETLTDFYISGSPNYERDSEGNWASVPPYFPESRYAESQVLAAIHRLMYEKSDSFGNAFVFLCPAYVAFAVARLLAEVDRSLVVPPGGSVGIALGWDAGDALYVGNVTRAGFHPRDVADFVRSLREYHDRVEKRFNELERQVKLGSPPG